MANLRCKRCNYQYKSDKFAQNTTCPNCGEKGSVRIEQSAQDLLNDDFE